MNKGDSRTFQVSRGDMGNGLTAVKIALMKHKPEMAADIYRKLSQIDAEDAHVSLARKAILDFLGVNFNDIYEEGAPPLNRHSVYLTGVDKKIDITGQVPIFSELARRVMSERRCMLKHGRLYTLFQAVKGTRSLAGDILELGVFRGGGAKFLAMVSAAFGLQRHLYALDTFAGHEGIREEDGFIHEEGMFATTSQEEVQAYLQEFANVTLVPGDVRDTLPALLERVGPLAMVHLDVDLYDPTAKALPQLFARLAPGGIIVVDDYGVISCPGVMQAVDEFVERQPAAVVALHQLTAQCVLVKK